MNSGVLNKIGSSLRQRIFIVIMLVVLLSQAAFIIELFIEKSSLEERRARIAKSVISNILPGVNGRELKVFDYLLPQYNNTAPHLWVERPDGGIAAGAPAKGLSHAERLLLEEPLSPLPDTRVWLTTTDWVTGPDSKVELLMVPLSMAEGAFNLCFVYSGNSPRFLNRYFPLGLVVVLLIGAGLSFALAHHLVKPLRQLRSGVLAITSDNLDQPLPVHSPNEIADVTRSVNALKYSLAQYNRSMHELMANVSHEMRSPLMRMTFAADFIDAGLRSAANRLEEAQKRGFAAAVPESAECPEGGLAQDSQAMAAKYLGYLKEDLAHMEKIVESSLLSSSLDIQKHGEWPLLDFSRLCRETLVLQARLAESGGRIFTSGIEDGVAIAADGTLLRQVVLNLVDNAVKYSRGEGNITVGLRKCASGRVAFYVENPCPPFAEEVLRRMFEPFYRAGQGGGKGVGLGLSIVEKIVRLHSGEVGASHNGSVLRVEALFQA